MKQTRTRRWILFLALGMIPRFIASAQPGPTQTQPPQREGEKKGAEKDPFAGLDTAPRAAPDTAAAPPRTSWLERLLHENFAFKTELFSQFATGYAGVQDPPIYSRQSAGFEILKKFSTRNSTVAAFNTQFRIVRRDNYIPVQNDMEGASREGFYPEYHNLYLDFYNVFNPLMGESARSRHIGRFHWRTGRFYLPFGLNLQTDTHGTLLQLSNERGFGFERDWYSGLYGSLTRNVNYDLYYLLGAGYYPRFRGQRGMLGARISLGNRFSNEYGLEGGISLMSGERISEHSIMRSPSVAAASPGSNVVGTQRVGLDGRYSRPLWKGTVAIASELSGGEDKPEAVFANLHQIEYISRSRRWGWATQYRRFWQDITTLPAGQAMRDKADASLIGEFSIYLRNDPSASRLHWFKLNLERQLERQEGKNAWLFSVQYYLYR